MERLTAKNKHGKPIIKDWPNYMEFDIINRLAAIEDILGDEYDLDELRETIQAKREGRCVVLPAPLGSQVWRIRYPEQVDDDGERWIVCNIRRATVEPCPYPLSLSMVNQIGKIYWLSEEEAQAALRREQE